MHDEVNLDELLEALDYVPAEHYEYQDWLDVGMALKVGGADWTDWDRWSQKDPVVNRYDPGACEAKWYSFDTDEVTPKTIFKWAMDGGWRRQRMSSAAVRALDWEDEITSPVQLDTVGEVHISEPEKWNPFEQIRTYIKALFRADEYVAYNLTLRHDEERDKWTPADSGVYTRTAGEILDSLDKYEQSGDLDSAMGTVDPHGAYVRFNPVDGKGVNDKNITRYTYTLIESDSMAVEQQLYMMHALKLPIRIVVHSGGKSIHAIVKVDAANKYEYKERVEYLHKICNDAGLKADPADKNESRLSRLPGAMRGEKKQYIVEGETGMPSWAAWYEWQESLKDKLPKVENLAEILSKPIELAPELIEGVLRQGHKMIISGPSKAGKSFALLELAFAIAEGRSWLGSMCTQGKVLYINMEIDAASFANRFFKLYDSNGPAGERHTNNIDIWNMRGYSMPLSKLLDPLFRRARDKHYSAIIIDPLYKVLDGDENSNSDVSKMVSQFDRITEETGAAVIYAHHFAKGVGGDRSAIDRGAGAGTFARDPDAILTMVQLDIENADDPQATAWRMEYVLREFPNKEPVSFWWKYPIHDVRDELDDVSVVTSETRKEKNRRKAKEEEKKEQIINTKKAAKEVAGPDGSFTLSQWMDAYNVYEVITDKPARDRLRQAGYIDEPQGKGLPAKWRKA